MKNVLYPEEFKSSYIKEHSEYENDLRKLIERSGFKEKFSGLYKQRLEYLEERQELCILRKNWFELLKHVDGELYVAKFKAQKNLRIIFCFIEYIGTKNVLLLCPFEEKEEGKSKDSYRAAIKIALSRKREALRNA